MSTIYPDTAAGISRRPSPRLFNLLGLAACGAGLAYAYYAQYGLGYEPCPLCIFQRVAMAALGAVFLIAAVHNPRGWGRYVYAALVVLTAGAGTAIAGRHVWLQNLPAEQVPACGPGLDYMLEALPLADTLRLVLQGSGECAEIDWVFLGLSMPVWTLAAFLVLGAWGVVGNRPGPAREL
ncbi:MAG: disulfide bond formation protein B [Candidatus Competibacteraceae bacterium]|nr:disulfide bond formation protein B [Candidatus Competibacteraceae bacterium]